MSDVRNKLDPRANEIAVAKAYFNLLRKNLPESWAFEAALLVFQFHNPVTPLNEAESQTLEIVEQHRDRDEMVKPLKVEP